MRRLLPLAALGLGFALAAGATPSAAARFHTRLVRSAPAADSTVRVAPNALELWFSERIELPVSRVQVLDPGQRPVPTARLTRDDDAKDAPVVARLLAELADGTYTVNWTAGARDGHAVKGSYRFTVRTK